MMKADKILIFTPYLINKNMGGPSGFLAHNLLDKPRDLFCFINDLFPLKFQQRFSFERIIRKLTEIEKLNDVEKTFSSIDASTYKYIYFHDCLTLFRCIKLINKNQIVILQSHSPELPSEEFLAEKNDFEMYNYVRKAEVASFNRADILVFPTKGASEIYQSLITDYSKVKYLLSGASREINLTQYPVDSTKINFLFIGRRNTIKGFDFLMKIFSNKKLRKDCNLILLGKKYKNFECPQHIYDVGYSSQPMNWANSVDYIINTNKQSYFDLSIIESLSIGARILMTNNFGHSYFQNISNDILTFEYGNVEFVVDLINSLVKTNQNQKSISNINLFENELSDWCYYNRLKIFIDEIK